MNLQEKQLVVESIKNDFKDSQASFIVSVKGMTVEALQGLRKGLHPKGSRLKVAKNTLLKKATEDLQGFDQLTPYFKDQIAIVFALKDVPEVAKILFTTTKENEKFILIAGSLNHKFITRQDIEALAVLPPREILLGQVYGALNAPMTGVVSVLHQVVARLLWVLQQAAEKKQ